MDPALLGGVAVWIQMDRPITAGFGAGMKMTLIHKLEPHRSVLFTFKTSNFGALFDHTSMFITCFVGYSRMISTSEGMALNMWAVDDLFTILAVHLGC